MKNFFQHSAQFQNFNKFSKSCELKTQLCRDEGIATNFKEMESIKKILNIFFCTLESIVKFNFFLTF